ncbi:succinyl-diaminopimelate desuccinylase [Aquabacter spiritensis]
MPPSVKSEPLPEGTDAVELARALLKIPSVTPDSAEAVDFVAAVLAAAGFRIDRFSSASAGPPIANLYAQIGESGPNLCFAGHVDVVPPGDPALWTHGPFSGACTDGLLFGRGAVDMKGGVAAAIAAALQFWQAGPPARGSISFLVTGDEEGPALDGTVKVVERLKAQGTRIDHCVLGEPTNPGALGDMVKIGRRGSLSGTVTVRGKQGHAAYPELADNPVPRLIRLLNGLIEAPLDHGSDHFPPSNLEIVSVDVGNPVFNVIPAEARAKFNVRFNDRFSLPTMQAEILRRLTAVAAPASFDLAFQPGPSESFVTAPGPFVDLVRGAVETVTGRSPALSTTGGTSDARFIKDLCPVVEFGLVGRTMHGVNEATAVDDLERLTEIYRLILDRYFANPPV